MSKTVKKKRPKNDPKKESNAIDAFLFQRDFERKPVAKDGSCLFRAVAEQVSVTCLTSLYLTLFSVGMANSSEARGVACSVCLPYQKVP